MASSPDASARWRLARAAARPSARRTASSWRAWAKPRFGGTICRTEPDRSALHWRRRRRRRRRWLQLAHPLAIERDEIHRVEQQRREAAIAHGGGDDLAREREQQARTFDQHERVYAFLRHVLDAEYAGIFQFESENQFVVGFRLAVKLECHLDVVVRQRLGVDVDLNADLRRLRSDRQRLRRVRVLE